MPAAFHGRSSSRVRPAIFLSLRPAFVSRCAPPPQFYRIFLFISFVMWNADAATSGTRIFCARRYWGVAWICRRGKSKRTLNGMKLWEKERAALSLWFSHRAFGVPLTSLPVSVAFRPLAFSALRLRPHRGRGRNKRRPQPGCHGYLGIQ